MGHPLEVLQVLQSAPFDNLLSLRNTLTLVDARKLADERYRAHDTFNQQISIADTVVGNKQELYQPGDQQRLIDYVFRLKQKEIPILFTSMGKIPIAALEGFSQEVKLEDHVHDHHSKHHEHPDEIQDLLSEMPIPESGYLRAVNEGEGYYSTGWRFTPSLVFNHQKLLDLLQGLRVERMKAVFHTDAGVFGYNMTDDSFTETELVDSVDSRLEVIAEQASLSLESDLLGCIMFDSNIADH